MLSFPVFALRASVIGCGLSWAAVSFLWPDWHYLKLSQTGAKAIQSDAGYLRSILVQLQHGSVDDMAYRVARRIGHERAAALSSTLSDMSGEPEKYGNRLQDGFQLLKINYSLLGYISSLGAYRSQMRHDEYNQAFLRSYFSTLPSINPSRAVRSAAEASTIKNPADLTPIDCVYSFPPLS